MVHVLSFSGRRQIAGLPESQLPMPVKLEAEDQLEDEHGPYNKRMKPDHPSVQEFEICTSMPPTEVFMQHDLRNQSGPLGLRLRKTRSFLELLQVQLSQQLDATANSFHNNNAITKGEVEMRETKPPAWACSVATIEKMKASNFAASLLKIGTWEYASRYEGDLVAKCYFAKRKLVWEILEGGLKSKIEIQWSDIESLRALCPEDGLSTLDIVLSRQPLFFREINPQPRKHTVWQATTDFTEGQASLRRQHILQCSQASLGKHLEKIIQFDPRLRLLSQEQADFVLESPFFEPKCCVFEDLDNSKQYHPFGMLNDELQDAVMPCIGKPSASLGNFVDQTGGQYISKTDDLVQNLFSDCCQTVASDEKLIMSKVNSLCCLLQNEEGSSANQSNDIYDGNISSEWEFNSNDGSTASVGMSNEVTSCGDMMMHLPHILPTLWFSYDNLQEDDEYERLISK